MFKCLFGHRWKPIAVMHYLDTSFGNVYGIPSTIVTFKCDKCNKIKVENLYASGYLELEDINK